MLVDIPGDNPVAAMRAIELLHQELPDSAVFAIGNLNQPQVIVSAMRAGAREYIERPTTTTDLLEAFVRLTTAQRRVQKEGPRGKVFTCLLYTSLIWRLYPSTRVFIDGRADLYGEQLLDQFADTYQFKGAWQQTFERWGIDTVIVPSDSALATGLRSSPGWKVAYEDSQAAVLTALPPASVQTKGATELPWVCTVSYTHLDVYKRQVVMSLP